MRILARLLHILHVLEDLNLLGNHTEIVEGFARAALKGQNPLFSFQLFIHHASLLLSLLQCFYLLKTSVCLFLNTETTNLFFSKSSCVRLCVVFLLPIQQNAISHTPNSAHILRSRPFAESPCALEHPGTILGTMWPFLGATSDRPFPFGTQNQDSSPRSSILCHLRITQAQEVCLSKHP